MIKDEQYPHHICIQQDISNIQQTNKMNAFFKKKNGFLPTFFGSHKCNKMSFKTCNGVSCLSIYWTFQAGVTWKWKASASLHARFRGLDWVRLVGSLRLGQLLQFKFWLSHYMMHVWWVYRWAHPEMKETQNENISRAGWPKQIVFERESGLHCTQTWLLLIRVAVRPKVLLEIIQNSSAYLSQFKFEVLLEIIQSSSAYLCQFKFNIAGASIESEPWFASTLSFGKYG